MAPLFVYNGKGIISVNQQGALQQSSHASEALIQHCRQNNFNPY
jgi:hypothetical protein